MIEPKTQTSTSSKTVSPRPAARLFLAAIVESSEDAIVSKDLTGIITSWNAAAERMFGYSADEIVGRSVLTIIPPELRYQEPQILRKIAAGQRIEHFETERIHKDGHRLHVALTVSPIRADDGQIIGASKILRDLTIKNTADELRNRLAAIVESSDDAIISKDLDGIIKSWNSGAERLFGYKAEEIVGRSILTLIPPHLQSEEPEILQKIAGNQRIDHYETQRISKSGKIIDVALTISPIRDAKGKIIGASKIARDISERKRAQQALIESEKLSATGRMAATIAHEINNPLESITNLAYLLTLNPSLDETARKYANMLLAEVGRASDITRQTLAFYRDTSKPSNVNLSELLDSLIETHESRAAGRSIRLTRDFRDDAVVWGLSSELKQVFVNLLLNAIDATGAGGEIAVRTRVSTKRVRVYICDTGSGIPPEIRREIFDPFFTTKSNKGNGLGLWVSKGIVSKHQGNIRVRSSIGGPHHGTMFVVTLPRNTRAITKSIVA